MILLDLHHDSWENEVMFVKIAARVLDLWLDTFSGPKWPKFSFWVLNSDVKNFFWDFMILLDSSRDSWENEVLFVKTVVFFWTYGLIHLLGPSGPNVVSMPQTLRSRNFLRFYDFIGFISWFLRKWGYVCENCSYGFGLMTWYLFWAQVAQV